MPASQDTEITLGTGRMLVLFFGLVAICGLCFGLGYSLGRVSSRPASSASADPAVKDGPKPASKSSPAAKPAASDLTFYQTVKQNGTDASSPPADRDDNAPSPVEAANAADVSPQPLVGTIDTNGYFVQVAAVTKKDDADALLSALKKKSYRVFIASNQPHDRLYHVQVGPFSNVKEAEATRTKLIADGYNPILKK